ncbi:hypothetical protein [Actinoplanes sp. N902-109]|uniref:hypothetical protein n=1 Tax=Actinoplanes sp. (strain N902-109) TaxID=649831 RepID=UPI0003296165|nr:hypothetical protein [Actinoplanes sp. N902-109]AGL16115.1 hypothetical protein L083_2605 [Actinoplanes sp. N902-109]
MHPATVVVVVDLPLKITLLVSPSEQGKDLDNIALEVLPIAHEVFQPHISPWLLAPEAEVDPDREHRRRLMSSLNVRSVTTYQVIELRELSGGNQTGSLRLALGCGDDLNSPWANAHDFVDRCLR